MSGEKIDMDKNIILIGMPGVGKSTIGVILAKVMLWDFLDTDLLIQTREGRSLQEIIKKEGLKAFCDIEERYVISISCKRTIIATGGSVVYRQKAMDSLCSSGVLVHLALPLDLLEKRLTDFSTRGVVMQPDQNLKELFHERMPLYMKYADITIDCRGKNHEAVLSEILTGYKSFEHMV